MEKPAVYTRVNIHGLYCYIEIIGAATALTTSGHCSNSFCPSSSTNNDTETIHPVISGLRIRQKIIFKCYGRIGHKADSCIIHGHKFLPTSIIINMNQFNALNGDDKDDQPRD